MTGALCVTVGTEVPVEPEPVLGGETVVAGVETVVTGLEWVVTGLETCVAARTGALARVCARAGCDARARTRAGFALDVATVRREVLCVADDAELAPEPVAGCAGCRALLASAAAGGGAVPAGLGMERATSVPTTTAADVARTSTARLRAAHGAAPLADGRA